jgi:hypothetical protein
MFIISFYFRSSVLWAGSEGSVYWDALPALPRWGGADGQLAVDLAEKGDNIIQVAASPLLTTIVTHSSRRNLYQANKVRGSVLLRTNEQSQKMFPFCSLVCRYFLKMSKNLVGNLKGQCHEMDIFLGIFCVCADGFLFASFNFRSVK